MRKLPTQEQTLVGTIEYEFDVAKLLSPTDTIASISWDLPPQLELVNSVIDGTKAIAFIRASGTAELYKKYWVSFTINSVGAPTPVSPVLSFAIAIVQRVSVEVL